MAKRLLLQFYTRKPKVIAMNFSIIPYDAAQQSSGAASMKPWPALADKAFSPGKAGRLNDLTHPRITQLLEERLKKLP